MTNQQHPITPPPELADKWTAMLEYCDDVDIFTDVARWGADQQLEQDAKWLDTNALFSRNLTILPSGDALRKEMRPKPPSLKEQALKELKHWDDVLGSSTKIIRCALEQLDD